MRFLLIYQPSFFYAKTRHHDTVYMTISNFPSQIFCFFFYHMAECLYKKKRSNLSQAQGRYIDRNIKKEDLGCALSPLINLLIMSYIPNMTLMKKAGPGAA